jgi:hypothetical protein
MSLLLFFVHNPNESSYLHKALSSPKTQEGTDNQEILYKNKYHQGKPRNAPVKTLLKKHSLLTSSIA